MNIFTSNYNRFDSNQTVFSSLYACKEIIHNQIYMLRKHKWNVNELVTTS